MLPTARAGRTIRTSPASCPHRPNLHRSLARVLPRSADENHDAGDKADRSCEIEGGDEHDTPGGEVPPDTAGGRRHHEEPDGLAPVDAPGNPEDQADHNDADDQELGPPPLEKPPSRSGEAAARDRLGRDDGRWLEPTRIGRAQLDPPGHPAPFAFAGVVGALTRRLPSHEGPPTHPERQSLRTDADTHVAGRRVALVADEKSPETGVGVGIALGIVFGAVLFALTSNPVWIAVGLAIGAALGVTYGRISTSDSDEDIDGE